MQPAAMPPVIRPRRWRMTLSKHSTLRTVRSRRNVTVECTDSVILEPLFGRAPRLYKTFFKFFFPVFVFLWQWQWGTIFMKSPSRSQISLLQVLKQQPSMLQFWESFVSFPCISVLEACASKYTWVFQTRNRSPHQTSLSNQLQCIQNAHSCAMVFFDVYNPVGGHNRSFFKPSGRTSRLKRPDICTRIKRPVFRPNLHNR